MPQTFDFQTAKITTKRVGKPVHVAKALLDIRDESGVSNETREVLKHAVDYIRALERAVSSMAVSNKARRTGTVLIATNQQDIRAATAALMDAAKKRIMDGARDAG
jgi:hypothetical protein